MVHLSATQRGLEADDRSGTEQTQDTGGAVPVEDLELDDTFPKTVKRVRGITLAAQIRPGLVMVVANRREQIGQNALVKICKEHRLSNRAVDTIRPPLPLRARADCLEWLLKMFDPDQYREFFMEDAAELQARPSSKYSPLLGFENTFACCFRRHSNVIVAGRRATSI